MNMSEMHYAVGFGGNELFSRIQGHKHIREILERVEKEDDSKKGRFQANLEVIVWGATYAEVKLNYYFEEVIRKMAKPEYEDLLWKNNRRKRLEDKIGLIQKAIYIEEEPLNDIKDVLKGEIKHIRNRILHYKETLSVSEVSEEWWNKEVDFEEDSGVIGNLRKILHPEEGGGPTPDIEKRLLSKEFDERRAEILDKVDRFSEAAESSLASS